MKYDKLIKWIIVFTLLPAILVYAQIKPEPFRQIKFNYITNQNGLTSSRVSALYRDSKGFLWAGTEIGLNCLDGYSTRNYLNDTSRTESLTNNNITQILEDKRHRLWISTMDGLNQYIPEKDAFKTYKFIKKGEEYLKTRMVNAIFEDKTGELWIALGKNGGIGKLNSASNNFEIIKIRNAMDNTLINSVSDIKGDAQNILWLVNLGNSIVSYDPSVKKFQIYNNTNFDMGKGDLKKLFIDKKNNLWILSRRKGLFKFNPQTKEFSQIQKNGNGTGTNGSYIRCMVEYDEKHILIGVDQGGINIFNTETGKFGYLQYNDSEPNSLNSNGIWSMHLDGEGILWVGTSTGGINYYNPKSARFKHYLHTSAKSSLIFNSVLSFYEDNYNKIWIGTDGGGLSIFNQKDNSFSNYTHKPDDLNSIGSNVILSIDEDKDQNIWMGTWAKGLIHFNRKQNRFFNYDDLKKKYPGIRLENIRSVKVDAKNNLWLSNFDLGIDFYNSRSGFSSRYRYDTINNKPYEIYKTETFFKGYRNKVWIAKENVINYIDSTSLLIKIFTTIPSTTIYSLYEDSIQNLWVGTSNKGLYCFNKYGEVLSRIDTKSGLPNNTVKGILEDDSQNLWMATDAGICKYNKTDKTFFNFQQRENLQGNSFKEWVYLKSRTGQFFFGGYNGFNCFYPDSIHINQYIPTVYIQSLQLMNQPVKSGDFDSLLRNNLDFSSKIIVKHKYSVITLGFSAVSFTFPEENHFAYKLDGFDKDWIYTPASKRYATYTNLNPGTYRFCVKASNNDNIWNNQAASLEIVILPPFWMTWWFRLLIACTLISLILLYLRIRLSDLKRINATLELRVTERTKILEETTVQLEETQEEISLQNEELKTQRDALSEAYGVLNDQKSHIEKQNQELYFHRNELESLVMERTKELIKAKEKAEESDKLKSSFLTNLSHEIRTPLNAIIGFSGFIAEQELSATEKKKFYEIITNNSDSLLSLISDVIDYSMLESGHIDLQITELPIAHLLAELKDIFQQQSKRQQFGLVKEIEFINNWDTDLEKTIIRTDHPRLKQIIEHLLNNAIKFTNKGVIQTDCIRVDNLVFFSIKDSGIGIKKENLELIFDRFRKIEDNTDQVHRGAGLGLAMVKELCKLLDIQIMVTSEFGHGSNFTLKIPCQTLPERPAIISDPISSYEIPNLEHIKILVAEDNLSNFMVIENLLNICNAKVLRAENGIQALEILNKNTDIMLVFMDIKMPQMDGIEAFKEMKKKKINIPVIAQTAYALAGEVNLLKQTGFDGYIPKPISPAEFYQTINKILFKKT